MADVILNGLDPLTGEPLVPALDLASAAQVAAGGAAHPAVAAMSANTSQPTLGLPFGIEPSRVDQAGWGVVFSAKENPAVVAALQPLVDWRTQQVGNPAKVKAHLVYSGEPFEDWLANHGVAPGDVKPARVPFYLLVVGDPEAIPFDFTQLLGVNYAVGRLQLETPDDYRRYAQAVVDYESKAGVTNAKEVVFFGTEHIADGATNLSCEQLMKPLANGVDGEPAAADAAGFKSTKLLGNDALKAGLVARFKPAAGANPPAVLFSASHGLGWPSGDARQPNAQGALLCGDWKGLGFSPLPVPPECYFAGADVKDLNVGNVLAFVFACFGVATPAADKYSFKPPAPAAQIAPKPFFSALPKALLSAASGPALAVIGHMERAWASSISPPGAGAQIQAFQFALQSILAGAPIGMALTPFRDRFGNFAGILNGLLASKLNNVTVDDAQVASAWTQQNDAEAYMLFGDPAVRLRLDKLQ